MILHFFVLALAGIFSVGFSFKRAPAPVAPSVPVAPVPIVPAVGAPFVGVTCAPRYCTKIEAAAVTLAAEKLTAILKMPEVKMALIAEPMIETNGLTPAQVADKILSVNRVFPVEFYYRRFTSAVAYRNVGSDVVHFNRKYFSSKTSACEYASTLAHESLGHVHGEFSHPFKATKTRPMTVPYSLNRVIESLCK